ncbi:MAG: cytochrome P450 [Microthrixaceae bacterium]
MGVAAVPLGQPRPEAFEDAETFVIDRQKRTATAFGLGIHRCIGSNLARMELRVALQEWVAAIEAFELADEDRIAVRWATGQVRGPRELPVRILGATPPRPTVVTLATQPTGA